MRLHSVLTILSHRPVDGFVDNHARYARGYGYRRAIVDGTHVYGERRQVLHPYHAINAQLVAMEQGALLLVLDPFSVVFGQRVARCRRRLWRDRHDADVEVAIACGERHDLSQRARCARPGQVSDAPARAATCMRGDVAGGALPPVAV